MLSIVHHSMVKSQKALTQLSSVLLSFETVSCILGWSQTHCLVDNGLQTPDPPVPTSPVLGLQISPHMRILINVYRATKNRKKSQVTFPVFREAEAEGITRQKSVYIK